MKRSVAKAVLLLIPTGRKAIAMPSSKSAWLFSGPGTLKAKASVALSYPLLKNGGLDPCLE